MATSLFNEERSIGDLMISWHRRQLSEAIKELSQLLETPTLKAQEVAHFFSTLAVYLVDRFGFEQKRLAKAEESERMKLEGDHAQLVRQVRACQARVNAGDVAAVRELLPLVERICGKNDKE